jgi:hypothetical protein
MIIIVVVVGLLLELLVEALLLLRRAVVPEAVAADVVLGGPAVGDLRAGGAGLGEDAATLGTTMQ